MSRDPDAIIKIKFANVGDVGLGGLDLNELWEITYSTPGGLFPQRIQFNQLFRYLSALGVEINEQGPFLDYDGVDPTAPDYKIGSIIRGTDLKLYECLIPNGPGSTIVSPIGNPLTWKIALEVAQATEILAGIAEIATQAETDAGVDDERFVTPKKLKASPGLSPVQTYQLLTGSRAANTVYTNTTDNTIEVAISGLNVEGSTTEGVYVAGVQILKGDVLTDNYMTFQVPSGATYELQATLTAFLSWAELR